MIGPLQMAASSLNVKTNKQPSSSVILIRRLKRIVILILKDFESGFEE